MKTSHHWRRQTPVEMARYHSVSRYLWVSVGVPTHSQLVGNVVSVARCLVRGKCCRAITSSFPLSEDNCSVPLLLVFFFSTFFQFIPFQFYNPLYHRPASSSSAALFFHFIKYFIYLLFRPAPLFLSLYNFQC